ncbi:MAG: imidazole glycerol phosphate synthase subunit HisH [Longimicrobiales bacterium]
MTIAVFDYGIGNLQSLTRAIEMGGGKVVLEADPTAILDADALVLPGVGTLAEAADRLRPAAHALRVALRSGFPCLGIGLGMQLLFEGGEEGMGHGLGVVPGSLRRMRARRVPHIGWNQVETMDDPLFTGIDGLVAYYANELVCEPDDPGDAIAWSTHEQDRFTAAVRRGATWGVQFRPEKSGAPGVHLIHNLLDAAARVTIGVSAGSR